MMSLRQKKPVRSKSIEGNLQFEIRFFEGVVRRDPEYIEALQILGDAYTKTGQWEKGLHIDQQLAKLCPQSPFVFYNLACSYSLMNRLDEAFAALQTAVQLGYNDARRLSRDPDLKNLRTDRRFERIRKNIVQKSASH